MHALSQTCNGDIDAPQGRLQRRLDHAEKPECAAMRQAHKIMLLALGSIAAANIHAEEVGRLFFTPAQRVQLDYGYAPEVRPEGVSNSLMLNGIVQKHGGKRTIWVNGLPQQAGASDERTPESLSVPLPGQKKSVKLKVGQRVLLNPSANQDSTKPDTPKP